VQISPSQSITFIRHEPTMQNLAAPEEPSRTGGNSSLVRFEFAAKNLFVPGEPLKIAEYSFLGVIVEISQQARDAYNRDNQLQADAAQAANALEGIERCETCSSRTYVDKSNDPSASFQTPTHISPGAAAAIVMAHEREHLASDAAKAEREGREIVSQSISLSMAMCPECGIKYVSGGSARTVSAEASNQEATVNILV